MFSQFGKPGRNVYMTRTLLFNSMLPNIVKSSKIRYGTQLHRTLPHWYSTQSLNKHGANSAAEKSNVNILPKINKNLITLKPIKPNDTTISCTIFNEKGQVTHISKKMNKWEFLNKQKLYPRDLRKIDTSTVDIIPSIVVKKNCILVNMLHIKALIKHNEVFIFDTADPFIANRLGVLMYDMELRLSKGTTNKNDNSNINNTIRYEHRALESILINIMASLEISWLKKSKNCKQILFDLENQVNRDKLKELLIYSKDLSSFYQKSFLIREVLDELLENDDDLREMYLNDNNVNLDFAELEMLIENYYIQCDEFVQQAASLLEDIKSTEEIVNIILDANRNSLMLLELKITIYTLSFTVASLLPAFYGMNLKNFIEDNNLGFGGVVLLSIVMALYITRSSFRQLQSVTKLSMFNRFNNNESMGRSKQKIKISSPKDGNQEPTYLAELKNMNRTTNVSWWLRFKRKLQIIWFGDFARCANSRENISEEQKNLVWKWLIDNKKD